MLTTFSFIAVLGFLVFIHELGHYMAARHVGVRVEAFSIGFPPKLWGKKYGDTEYLISWIPLGGYVRLFGQNMDDEDPNDPQNYASKTILQRVYILVAGPVMNLIFAVLFMPLVYWIGTNVPSYFSAEPLIRQVTQGSFAETLGIKEGDRILALNQNSVLTWKSFYDELGALGAEEKFTIKVDREGSIRFVSGSVTQMKQYSESGWSPFMAPVVGALSAGSPAQKAGIKSGDRILSINKKQIQDWGEIRPFVQKTQTPVAKDSSSQPSAQTIEVELEREGQTVTLNLTPYWNNGAYLLGMSTQTSKYSYSLLDSISKGTGRVWDMFGMTVGFLGKILQGGGSMKDLGGPVRIGQAIGDAARSGISDLFFMMSIISLQLGVFNLLPIPALDGGHLFFLLIEKIKGGSLSAVFRERIQIAGFSLLLGLMLFVTYNDVLQML